MSLCVCMYAYLTSWNTITYNKKALHTELRVESEVKGSVGSYAGTNQYIPGSASLLCHVKKGEHVWVQTSSGITDNYVHDWRDSTSYSVYKPWLLYVMVFQASI
jgi:hypothetical protein